MLLERLRELRQIVPFSHFVVVSADSGHLLLTSPVPGLSHHYLIRQYSTQRPDTALVSRLLLVGAKQGKIQAVLKVIGNA